MESLELIKNKLTGLNLANLLKSKKITKWKVHRDCGLSYRTIWNWEKSTQRPSDESAMIVGQYLGLIPPDEVKKEELRRKLTELEKEISRLK